MEHINRDDLRILEALVASPAYRTLTKLVNHQKNTEISALIEASGDEVHKIQGRIRGLDLVKNLPYIMAENSKRLDIMDQQKEEKESKKKPKRR